MPQVGLVSRFEPKSCYPWFVLCSFSKFDGHKFFTTEADFLGFCHVVFLNGLAAYVVNDHSRLSYLRGTIVRKSYFKSMYRREQKILDQKKSYLYCALVPHKHATLHLQCSRWLLLPSRTQRKRYAEQNRHVQLCRPPK